MAAGATVSRGNWAPARAAAASVRMMAGAVIATRTRSHGARALRGFAAEESLGTLAPVLQWAMVTRSLGAVPRRAHWSKVYWRCLRPARMMSLAEMLSFVT